MEPIEYLSVAGLFKARAAEESGERVLYMEASNESADIQGEKVLAKSLQESADYFLKYGNIDLDHRTLRSPQGPGDNPYLWEIGRPVRVDADGDKTLVKAVLYQGEGEAAKNANFVWDSLTRTSPPARWYPSVGGQVLHREPDIDPLTKAKVTLITKVRWTNIGLSRTPVNPSVPTVSAATFAKALAAGIATDLNGMDGGASLSRQSLDTRLQSTLPIGYAQSRDALAKWVRSRPNGAITLGRLIQVAESLGLSRDEAEQAARRFLRDLELLRSAT